MQILIDKIIDGIEDLPAHLRDYSKWLNNGWHLRYRKCLYPDTDWETGVEMFKRNGYRNKLTLPSTIIPMTLNRDRTIEFYANAVEIVLHAEVQTINQPKNWKGECQIPVEFRRNEWIKEAVSAVRQTA